MFADAKFMIAVKFGQIYGVFERFNQNRQNLRVQKGLDDAVSVVSHQKFSKKRERILGVLFADLRAF